jgi:hypothetical protein
VGNVLLILVPLMIVVRIVAPRQSKAALDAAGAWLERNNRSITIGVSVIFGTFFLIKGMSGLL